MGWEGGLQECGRRWGRKHHWSEMEKLQEERLCLWEELSKMGRVWSRTGMWVFIQEGQPSF